MSEREEAVEPVEKLLQTPNLSNALESDKFKHFLDHIPFAVAVAELRPDEHITYANLEFERLTGHSVAEIEGKSWETVTTRACGIEDGRQLNDAIADEEDYIGAYSMTRDGATVDFDAWSNIIEDDEGTAMFRLVALAEISRRGRTDLGDLEHRIREKDTLLRELQHRVKNNLQMITTLIRLETRNLPDDATGERFHRLAGRVDSLALLYQSLSDGVPGESVDLGVYLSQIASAVMKAHAVEGIRLDLKVDSWPVSINIAMPTGLVVNELLTNSLKHAFSGRSGGTITLHSLVDDDGCRVIVADDGNGLADGDEWPRPGRLGALIVQSLQQNAKATVKVESARGNGVRVTIFFARAKAAPEAG